MDQLQRAGQLKGELVSFALSERFDGALRELVWDSFPDGIVDDESIFTSIIENFLFHHKLAGGERVVERFVTDHADLPERDKALLLGWRDNVQGMFEVGQPYGDDGVVAFNHVDELTHLSGALQHGPRRCPTPHPGDNHDRWNRARRERVDDQRNPHSLPG
jgi:hypothetical protein